MVEDLAGKPNNEVAAHVGPTNTWIKIPLFTLLVSLSAILFAGMGFTHWARTVNTVYFQKIY